MDNEVARGIWARFDAEVSDELLRAVAGAFAFVACADSTLAESEVEGFVEWVRAEKSFEVLDSDQLEVGFRELAHAFAMDFATGAELATSAVARVKGDARATELVLRAAQVAMVADERLEAAEEVAMRRLCEALGVNPEEW